MSDEKTFEEALRIQAVGAGAPTLTLDDVRGRARGIRRRRAAVVAGGAAALVAAAVLPVALLAGGGPAPDSLPPASSTPTVVDTANPQPEPSQPATAEPDLADRVDQRGTWVEGRTIHPAVGEPFEPEVDGEISTVMSLADGRWVIGAYPDGSFVVVVTDSTGQPLASYEALEAGLATDDGGGAVAWFDPDGAPRVMIAGEDEPLTMPVPDTPRSAGRTALTLLPGCSLEECVLLVEIYDDSADGVTQYAVTSNGETESLERLGLLSLSDVSPDGALVAGLISADELTLEYCYAVLVFATGEELWRTCDAGSFRFSPDGAHVLGIDPYLDGFGHSFVEVRDALDGTVRGRFEPWTVFDETWESADTFLVSTQEREGTNQLLRVQYGDSTADNITLSYELVVERDGEELTPSPLRLAGR